MFTVGTLDRYIDQYISRYIGRQSMDCRSTFDRYSVDIYLHIYSIYTVYIYTYIQSVDIYIYIYRLICMSADIAFSSPIPRRQLTEYQSIVDRHSVMVDIQSIVRYLADGPAEIYTLQEMDSSVKKFSSCRLKFPEKNNKQCMENLLKTTGQIQGQVQP